MNMIIKIGRHCIPLTVWTLGVVFVTLDVSNINPAQWAEPNRMGYFLVQVIWSFTLQILWNDQD
ncbi:hypothetical protein [Vibrio phage RYC]|nr:hypothetical protein [Vibrio phage RYC]